MGDESLESKHARRRQQVRAAQAKHRRRKQEYISTLEKEVLRLQVQTTQIRRSFVMAKMETAVLKEMLSPQDVGLRSLKEELHGKALHAQDISYLPEMTSLHGSETRLSHRIPMTSTACPVPWMSSEQDTPSLLTEQAEKGTQGLHPIWTNVLLRDKAGRAAISDFDYDVTNALRPSSDAMLLSTGFTSDTSWESPKSDDWSVANLTCAATEFV